MDFTLVDAVHHELAALLANIAVHPMKVCRVRGDRSQIEKISARVYTRLIAPGQERLNNRLVFCVAVVLSHLRAHLMELALSFFLLL